jgi:hypothetical protein
MSRWDNKRPISRRELVGDAALTGASLVLGSAVARVPFASPLLMQ